MGAMLRCAWIAGGTGLVGGHCLRRLLQHPGYAKTQSLGRRPIEIEHPRLTQHVVDLASFDASALDDPDDVFCALGTTLSRAGSKEAFRQVDHDYVLSLARTAANRGAKRFILVSSVGSSSSSPSFYLRVKGELENALALLPIETLVLLRPSFLLGDREEFRWSEHVGGKLAHASRFLLFGPMRIYGAIQADEVAAAMVGAALHAPPGRHISHYDEILAWGSVL